MLQLLFLTDRKGDHKINFFWRAKSHDKRVLIPLGDTWTTFNQGKVTDLSGNLLHDYNYFMFKIIVIGNSAVGKTSVVNRFVGDRFDHNYKATIAADFQVKILNL